MPPLQLDLAIGFQSSWLKSVKSGQQLSEKYSSVEVAVNPCTQIPLFFLNAWNLKMIAGASEANFVFTIALTWFWLFFFDKCSHHFNLSLSFFIFCFCPTVRRTPNQDFWCSKFSYFFFLCSYIVNLLLLVSYILENFLHSISSPLIKLNEKISLMYASWNSDFRVLTLNVKLLYLKNWKYFFFFFLSENRIVS